MESLDRSYTFEVEWFVDKEKILQTTLATDANQAVLNEKYLIGKLGKMITCQVRGRFEEGPFSPVKISPGFFAGIEILNVGTSITLKPGEVDKITFKLTVPLVCSPEVKDCSIKLYTGFDMSNSPTLCANQKVIDEAVIKCPEKDVNNAFCGLIITNKNWDQTHEIIVAATIHSQTAFTKKVVLKLYTTVSGSLLWTNIMITIPVQIIITAVNIIENLCYSYNDPHMRTFDGQLYEHQYSGTYILYRNKKSQFEIQAYYTFCPGSNSVTCNCAIAIKTGDMLIIFDSCGNLGSLDPTARPMEHGINIRSINLPTAHKDQKETLVYQLNGGLTYKIYLVYGTVIEITKSYSNLLNVNIRASAYDFGSTEGLCGTFTSSTADDFKLRDGSLVGGKTFSLNWQVSTDQGGFFKGIMDQATYKGDLYCKCSMKNGKVSEKACAYNNNIQVCHNVKHGTDITNQLHKTGKRRKRSNIESNFSDDDSGYLMFLESREKRQTQTNNKVIRQIWTADTARKYCQETLQKSPVGKLCNKVPNVDFKPKVDFCVLDIMATQTTDYTLSAVEAVKEECVTELDRNTTLWIQTKDPKTGTVIQIPPPDIEGNLCINDCSNRGTCKDGLCVCQKEYIGPDCSIRSDEPPKVFYILQNGTCQKQDPICMTAVVKGLNFVESDKLTCHFKTPTKNLPDVRNNMEKTTLLEMKAQFISIGEVECPIPATHNKDLIVWSISISNDGVLKSKDSLLFTVYNAKCISCNIKGICIPQKDGCLIGGSCFKPGDKNPDMPCEICRPKESVNQWSSNDCMINDRSSTNTHKILCLKKEDIIIHPSSCSHYIKCSNWKPNRMLCGHQTYFNPKTKLCENASQVPMCKNGKWVF